MLKFFTYVFPAICYILMGIVAVNAPVKAGEAPKLMRLDIQPNINVTQTTFDNVPKYAFEWRIQCGEPDNFMWTITIQSNNIANNGIEFNDQGMTVEVQSTPAKHVDVTGYISMHRDTDTLFISRANKCSIERIINKPIDNR